ncbi:MAG: helix-turn-helix transcriptional regulator [Alphaproteobacteria bacterium]|nr:helix-turn-helix transcriptional regulator [Alphaproteobacteria bacterium]MDE1987141.1 helix-turn-helix transcriptional regulator [Alphaproteobacteria bacterium]MDE2162909.1 helix-turn-helix transcriptional regulator [Alphaproteobacteria bacterium]MDE2266445.1 helix-turn-helix transcriptional regulator [Alphaproteobacteria bacterium]MDE2499418.1 helix-turn-helix transcriptional regulator [Alphaproteobacteria bacterium]
MKSSDALMVLASLAQETRLAIFRRLVRSGPTGEAAGAIAEALDTPAPTLSFHLKELERAGLIVQHRESRHLIYAVRTERMRELLGYLMKDCCAGHPEICNIVMEECCEPSSRSSSCA